LWLGRWTLKVWKVEILKMVVVGPASATMKTSTTLKPLFTIITSATCMPNLQGLQRHE
jgi:hypothetical protein